MKLNRFSTILATTCLAFGLSSPLISSSALADTANSTATVSFTDPTGSTKPTDPNGGGNEVEGEGTTGHDGVLTIDYASNLKFGSTQTSGSEQTLKAKNETLTIGGNSVRRSNFVQVTDQRGGSLGWTLSVNQTAPFTHNENGHVIQGTTIKFANRALVHADADQKPTLTGGVTPGITPGVDVPMIEAETGKGYGTTSLRLGGIVNDETDLSDDLTLTIPGNAAQAGDYTGTLTWSLNALPDSKM